MIRRCSRKAFHRLIYIREIKKEEIYSTNFNPMDLSKKGTHPNDKSVNIPIKGKDIALTSIKSYRSEEVQKKMPTQAREIEQYLNQRPIQTSRQIAKALQMERGSVTRSLYNLEKGGRIYVVKVAPCITTKKPVRYYGLAISKAA